MFLSFYSIVAMTALLAIIWPIVLMFPLVTSSTVSSATVTTIEEKADITENPFALDDIPSLPNTPSTEKDITDLLKKEEA